MLTLMMLALAATACLHVRTRAATELFPQQVAAPAPGQTYYTVASFPGANAGAQIAACIAALPSTGGVCDARSLPPSVSMPTGLQITGKPVQVIFGFQTIALGGTIAMQNVSGVEIAGSSASLTPLGGTIFNWVGNATAPAFALTSVANCRLSNFRLQVYPPYTLASGIYIDRGVNAQVDPTLNAVENVTIISDSPAGLFGKGVQMALGPGGDANNDWGMFTRVHVIGYGIAGFSIEHTQSKAHRFFGCFADGRQVGQYGVTTALGPGARGGSFMWFGGGMSANAAADFYVGAPDDNILIQGGYSENSARFLVTAGGSADSFDITVQGFTWMDSYLASDGKMIVYTQRGTLTLIGNVLGTGANAATIFVQPSQGASPASVAVAIGNEIGTTVAQPFDGPSTVQWTLLGNTLQPNGGASTPLANAP
jgi:hypothetical protein